MRHFLIGMMGVIVILFWLRDRLSEGRLPPPAEYASPPALTGGMATPQLDAMPEQQSQAAVEPWSGNPMDDTLALIRSKLRQLSETGIADKDAQDELRISLLAILTDDNAAAISQSLSADELGSPFGLAALQRWLKVDANAAASWIAARPDTTDDQAWAVAHRLVEDQRALERYCRPVARPSLGAGIFEKRRAGTGLADPD